MKQTYIVIMTFCILAKRMKLGGFKLNLQSEIQYYSSKGEKENEIEKRQMNIKK